MPKTPPWLGYIDYIVAATNKQDQKGTNSPVRRQLEEAVHVHGQEGVDGKRQEAERVAFERGWRLRVTAYMRRDLNVHTQHRKTVIQTAHERG